MENLNLPRQEILEILKQLKYCCDEFELYAEEDKGEVKIMISDIDPSNLKRAENLYNIAEYLRKNGLDFSITFDLINEFPDMYIDDKHPTDDFIQLGIIKGENIQSIKTKIEELINMLSSERSVSIVENILAEDRLSDKIFALSENGIGYLIFCGEKIPIGEISTGKFKLVETLCGMGLGRGKTIDVVFDYIKVEKDKNKVDSRLESPFLASNRKLELIKNQMREVNRAITEYIKRKKIKKLRSRLKINSERNNVWMEEKVGRRG